jgi:hypothetical protein
MSILAPCSCHGWFGHQLFAAITCCVDLRNGMQLSSHSERLWLAVVVNYIHNSRTFLMASLPTITHFFNAVLLSTSPPHQDPRSHPPRNVARAQYRGLPAARVSDTEHGDRLLRRVLWAAVFVGSLQPIRPQSTAVFPHSTQPAGARATQCAYPQV